MREQRGGMDRATLALYIATAGILISIGAILYCRETVASNYALAHAINRLADKEEK